MLRRAIFVLIIIAALVFLGVIIFGGGNNPPKPTPEAARELPDYSATDASVVSVTDGVINGDDVHRSIRITVNRNMRTIDIIQGYQGNVIKTQSFANNESAYRVFLSALNNEGFTRERRTSMTDVTGVCPLGQRYIFSLDDAGDADFSRWSTTCSGFGTFGGRVANTRTLFQRQITNYSQFTRDVNLN